MTLRLRLLFRQSSAFIARNVIGVMCLRTTSKQPRRMSLYTRLNVGTHGVSQDTNCSKFPFLTRLTPCSSFVTESLRTEGIGWPWK